MYYELCGTGLCHLNYNTCHTCLVAQTVKCLPAMGETRARFLGQEDPLEKEMVIHSSTLAWKFPWMEEPDRLQSMGLQRVRHNWGTSLSHLSGYLLIFLIPFKNFRIPLLFFFLFFFNIYMFNWNQSTAYEALCRMKLCFTRYKCEKVNKGGKTTWFLTSQVLYSKTWESH